MASQNPNSIILITETWLTPNVSDGFFGRFINNYHVLRSNRDCKVGKDGRGGGVLILVPRIYNISLIKTNSSIFFESIWCKIYFPDNTFIIISLYYRSPSFVLSQSVNELIDHLQQFYNNTCSSDNFILCGDFNFPTLKWNSLNQGHVDEERFRDFTHTLGFKQFINEATHINGNSLDLIFTNNQYLISKIKICDNINISDHYAIFFESTKCIIPNDNSKKRFLNFNKADNVSISRELLNIDWSLSFSICTNVDQMCDIFNSIFLNIIYKFVPFSLVSNRLFKWSKDTIRFNKRQRKLHLKFKKNTRRYGQIRMARLR